MSSILIAAGFKHIETLEEFCNRYPNVSNSLDSELLKIWICHKDPEGIPLQEDISTLPCLDYHRLAARIQKKVTASTLFYSLLTEISVTSIFDKIYTQCNKQLTTYLFSNCYLFYNWGINAFEPLLDHFDIHLKIKEIQNQPLKLRSSKHPNDTNECISEKEKGERSVDELMDSRRPKFVKIITFKTAFNASKKVKKFSEFAKNSRNPYQETFSLNKILYDSKQRSRWPKNNILSKHNIEDLLLFIIKVKLSTNDSSVDKLLAECQNWSLLRSLLQKFLKSHEQMSRINGYGRILKKHLKNVKITSDRRLHPIPKTIVSSYVLDILRRAFPIELFDRNRIRKAFFKELIKIINGNKNESFIWYNLLRLLLLNKHRMPWCTQLGDHNTQSQILLKLFKFIIIHYVFVLLRNNFYITETGYSGFGLRYYRKSDMESASVACLKNLLKDGQIREIKCNELEEAIEWNWLNSGVISKLDLKRKLRKKMSAESEYKQPVARVRFLPKSDDSDELRIITSILKRKCRLNDSNCASKKLLKFFLERLSWRKKNLFLVKLFLEFLVIKLGLGMRPLPSNPKLEVAWKKAVHLKEKYGKLFFVKADISGAFNSVKYTTLEEVLKGVFEQESNIDKLQLRKIIEWKRVNWRIQKVVRFSFSNRAGENSIMINRSLFLQPNKKMNHCVKNQFLIILKQVVMEQAIEINGRQYKLMKGLAQGSAGKFSPQLCEIYYSVMDRQYFGEFMNSNDVILLRAVDDYLFITPDPEKARKFLEIVQRGVGEFNVTFNNRKLRTNLTEDVQSISYLGLTFNFDDMSVKPNYSKHQKGDFLSMMNLCDKWGSNHFKKEFFIKTRCMRVLCLKLHPIVTSGNYNNLKVMRRAVFEASLMQLFRVISLSNYLFSGADRNEKFVYKIILMSKEKINRFLAPSVISVDEVNWLFYYAGVNILHKYCGQFKFVHLMLRYKLKKSEKVFSESGKYLLLRLLREDILNEEYWKEVKDTFKQLNSKPIKN